MNARAEIASPPPSERLPVILRYGDGNGARAMSDADAIEVFTSSPWLIRGQARVQANAVHRRLFVALAANSPALLTKGELIEILWGDRADGGPDDAENAVDVHCQAARLIGAALGFTIENFHGVGFRARRTR